MLNEPLPPLLPTATPLRPKSERRNKITIKLLFIAGLVLVLQAPLHLINTLQAERRANNGGPAVGASLRESQGSVSPGGGVADGYKFEPYRVVERALKHSVLVLALVFTAFFLFETLAAVRLHAVHYGLVGGAMCLFYLALLALGEVWRPEAAYAGAAGASSLMIVFYSVSVLRSWARAAAIGGLLASVHSVLYVVLRMESYALLAGTAALFAALGAVMFFTRNVDWHAQDLAEAGR